jgi:uncharacterized protein (TIGR02757 family)
MARIRSRTLSAERARRLRPLLDRFQRGYDAASRIGFDPVELPRRYPDPGDAEVAGLLAASLAYGRADVFKPRLERVLAVMGPSPAAFAERFARSPDPGLFAGFRYRFNRAEDVAALVAAVGHLRAEHGSLGARFAALLRRAATEGAAEPLRQALARFASELRGAPPVGPILRRRGRRGLLHLCPDPASAGACKRWNLYLRWMVRGPDGVDLGLWREVPASALTVPLDTHVARIARYLGLTDRRDLTWRTAEEVTRGLRRLDPEDPVRFDFALCHHGMSGACPPRRDPARCGVCPLRSECRARAGRTPRSSPPRASPRSGSDRAGTS